MEQNDAFNRQEEELENEQEEVATTENQTDQAPSVSMEDLLEEEGLELDFPKQGEVRTGIIATLGEGEILVSVGTKSEGVIAGRELESIPVEERSEFEVGQEIPVYVITPEDSNGNVVLSFMRAKELKDWEDVARMLENEEVVESEIIGFNKGGLIVPIGQLRGFVPSSQVSLLRRMSTTGDTPEQRWGDMVGDEISVCIIEVDRERRRLILSERQALQETRESLKDRLLDELGEGDIRTGRVTSLADFGAFVNIEGADGLVHLSEISWDRIQHPNEVLEVGQEVEVKVISIDRERKRIGLSIRQLQKDPWVNKVDHLKEGMLVEGKITHLTKFGAFARIGEDLEGLIHVSELSEQRIAHPKEIVHEDDVVTLRIIKIDPERHRIGLSLRKVDSPAYADLDWKMALSQEMGKSLEVEEDDEGRSILIESEPAEEVETESETVAAGEVAETEAEAVADEVEAEEAVEEVEVEEAAEEAIEEAEVTIEAEEELEEVEAEAEDEESETEEDAEEVVEAVADEIEAEETIDEVEIEEDVDVVEAEDEEDVEEAVADAEAEEVEEAVADEIEAEETIDEVEIEADADVVEAEDEEDVEEAAADAEAEEVVDAVANEVEAEEETEEVEAEAEDEEAEEEEVEEENGDS